MIKIALKHFIYEHCIDVLFEHIFGNFIPVERDDTGVPYDVLSALDDGRRIIPNAACVNVLASCIASHQAYEKCRGLITNPYEIDDLRHLAKKVRLAILVQQSLGASVTRGVRGTRSPV